MSSIADLLQTDGATRREAVPNAFVLGVVTENYDKDNPGQVKVSFIAWEDQKNVCEWIPCLQRYAGDEYGGLLMPEVGDQVVIGFLGAGKRTPFVLGSIYPGGAQMVKESFQKKNGEDKNPNILKRLRSKGGVEVAISDEPGKQWMRVTTPKELTVLVDDEKQTVTVSDKNKENKLFLDCAKGEVELLGKSAVSIKAGSCEIKVDGQGGSITLSGNQIELKANQAVKLTGQQMLSAQGGALQLQGRQTASLKGGIMTEVSGGILKLN